MTDETKAAKDWAKEKSPTDDSLAGIDASNSSRRVGLPLPMGDLTLVESKSVDFAAALAIHDDVIRSKIIMLPPPDVEGLDPRAIRGRK